MKNMKEILRAVQFQEHFLARDPQKMSSANDMNHFMMDEGIVGASFRKNLENVRDAELKLITHTHNNNT